MGFQIAGIAILLLFYGCYLIKMMSQWKKGIKTDQIGKGKTGPVKTIELTMKAATYTVLATEIISIALNISYCETAVRIAGTLIAATGVAIFIVSVWTMQDSWRAGVAKTEKTRLITGGIYQMSRNPAFLGFDLLYIGIAMMFFHLVLLVISLFAIVMLHLQIVKVEENFLMEVFGEEYRGYRQKVCRYCGRKR